jgi:hypothetical protein
VKLSSFDLETLHQIALAEAGDRGPVCAAAHVLYRMHVLLIIALIRAGRLGR